MAWSLPPCARDCSGKPGGQNASGRQLARATLEAPCQLCGQGAFGRGLAAESANWRLSGLKDFVEEYKVENAIVV